MTREQLLALGLSEEQVNQIMGMHGSATQNLRTQVTTLTNQLSAIQNPQPTPSPNPTPNPEPTPANDEELANMRRQIDDLQRENARKDILAYAVSKGLTGEQVQEVLNAFTDNVDAAKSAIDSIGQIISENRESAARAKEQEIAGNAGNPGGGSGNPGGDGEKSSAEKIASKLFGAKKEQGNILSHYVSGGN